MSWSATTCHHCHHPTTTFHAPIAFGPDFACAVVWLCAACEAGNIDMFAIGPDEPKPGHCLECDAALDPQGRCDQCGNSHADLVARVHAHCGAPPRLEALRDLQDRGLYRLAFNAIHLRLLAQAHDLDALVAKAKLLTEAHRPAQAVPILRRVLADTTGRPRDPAIAIDLGVALANSGDNSGAIEIYERFLVEHPAHEARCVVLSNIGACYSALGQVAQGEAYHRRAVAADPLRIGSRWNLFANLCKARRYADAIVVLEETIALPSLEDSERENLHAFRGQLYTALDRLDEALAAFDASLVSDPTQPDRQFSRAKLLVRLGRLDQARVALHHVLDRCPSSEAAKELLAKLGARGASETN